MMKRPGFIIHMLYFISNAAVHILKLCLLNFSCRIKNLSLSKIYGLTDISIQFLAHNSKNLQLLNIQGCWRVTNDAVRSV